MEEQTVNGHRERNRVERTETVSSITSAQPFAVSDGTGSVTVSPDGADVDNPERVTDRFEAHMSEQQLPSGLAGSDPPKGRYIISTRSEEQIVGSPERTANIARIVTGVLAVAGVALVIAGLLS